MNKQKLHQRRLRRRALLLLCQAKNAESLMACYEEAAVRARREARDLLRELDEDTPSLPENWMELAEKPLPEVE